MAEVPGTITIAAGPSPQEITELGSVTTEQLNNAAGADGTYIDGVGKPSEITGSPWNLRARSFIVNGEEIRVHRAPGEAGYMLLQANSVTTLVTANFANFELHERVVNVRTGKGRDVVWQLGDRITDVNAGGLADNPKTVLNQKVPILAVPRLGPDEYGVFRDFARLVTANA